MSNRERHPCIPVAHRVCLETEMCVETKCIDVPLWLHKTSNKHLTTMSSLPYTMYLLTYEHNRADKMMTIIYADFSLKHIATWIAALSDHNLIHSQVNLLH